ncbi:MAG: CDGSH iron-sulfur domain-containing protein [Gemmatimonadota bacterium]
MADEAPVTIKVNNNGPYTVEGPVRIVDADGNEYDISAKKKISLCRCGASTKKPFCDGTHSRMGFEAAERAVREAEGGGQAGAPGSSEGGASGGQMPGAI